MWTPLLPRRLDNAFGGNGLAPWLLGLAVLVKSAMSLNAIFNGRVVAGSADGIPLDTYPAPAAAAVVSLFGLWGVSHLTLCLLAVLVLVRYRAAIPLMFFVLLLEQLGRKAVVYLLPIGRSGPAVGSVVSQGLLAVLIAGLVLSMWTRTSARTAE